MNWLEVLVLGIIQGLTEFLPISSSGHLVILQRLFGIQSDNVLLEVTVHCGTLLSVAVVFWQDLKRLIQAFFKGLPHPVIASRRDKDFQLILYLFIGTLPAVVVGLLWKDQIEAIFHSAKLVGVTLMVTGLVLGITHFVKPLSQLVDLRRSLLIGIAQAVAILPGISRSGATIATGLFLGLKREEATRFSFLLSIPAILGALILHLPDLLAPTRPDIIWWVLLLGFSSAFIVGYLAIRWLLQLVNSGKFAHFAPYCLLVGLLVLLFLT
jgi:undecaprenyl-diphosphatase